MTLQLIPALLIIGAAIYLMIRQVEVRLVLFGAGLLLALLVGKPLLVFDAFTNALVEGGTVPSICTAMGFAAVLKATHCDKHLVYMLLAPVRRIRWAVAPGGILAAFLVNMAVPSQASTAALIGPILAPLLIRTGYSPVATAAALVLGASMGGDLLNPGARDVQAIAHSSHFDPKFLSARVIPAVAAGALVAAVSFALMNRARKPMPGTEHEDVAEEGTGVPFHVDPVRALIPLVPIILLLLAFIGFPPLRWLTQLPAEAAQTTPAGFEWRRLESALPVVRAMLVGVMLAGAVGWRDLQQHVRSLFEGIGTAYGGIISLIVTARCFGAGVAAAGVTAAMIQFLQANPLFAPVLTAGTPWLLATLSGSGSGAIQALAGSFLAHLDPGHAPVKLCTLACLAGAFGRTMSPVAAVVIYSSTLLGVSPTDLVRKLVPALLIGAAVAFVMAYAVALPVR